MLSDVLLLATERNFIHISTAFTDTGLCLTHKPTILMKKEAGPIY